MKLFDETRKNSAEPESDKDNEKENVKENVKENEKQSEKENDRILRRLSRAQLLDLLIEQSREKEALEKRVEELEAELASRRIDVEEAGNLAKAALKLNHIFEDAQKAADQYLLNIREKEKILDEKLREAKKEEE